MWINESHTKKDIQEEISERLLKSKSELVKIHTRGSDNIKQVKKAVKEFISNHEGFTNSEDYYMLRNRNSCMITIINTKLVDAKYGRKP